MGPHRHTPLDPSNRTNRRHLLAVSGTAIASTLAGCTGAGSRIRTRSLDPETTEEDDATHLTFRHDETRIAEVTLSDRWLRAHHRATYPIRTNVWHADGTTLDRLRYEFHPVATDHPPELYLERPGGSPWEPIEFARGDDPETTVLEIPDLGFQGRGSVALEFLVDPRTDDEFDLRVDVSATVSSDRFFGRVYHLNGETTRTLPGYAYFE